MAKRPKRYGAGEHGEGLERGGRRRRRDEEDRIERARRPHRASEAEIWEREDSLDLGEDATRLDELERQDRTR